MKFISKFHALESAWVRVIILAIAAFVFNTTEFIPVALLSDIASGFTMPVSSTGLMITIYAWVVALASLPLMLLTAKFERKKLLVLVFATFIVGHIITSLSWRFEVLILGRVITAFSHAIFWSITASLAVRVAPIGKKMQALGLLATGTALATVLGLPIGRIIGQLLGWRMTFFCIGMIAVLSLIGIVRLLPKLPSQDVGNFKSIPLLFKKPALLGIFALTVLIITAHFAAYSYIEPFAQEVVHLSTRSATLLLLLFGVAGIVGSIIFSRLSSKNPKIFFTTAIAIVALCLLLLLPIASLANGFMVLSFIWGTAITCVGLMLQVKVLDLAPEATDVAMSIYSGIVNIGIGGGALVGTIIIGQWGLHNIGYISGFLASLAFVLSVYLFKKFQVALSNKTA